MPSAFAFRKRFVSGGQNRTMLPLRISSYESTSFTDQIPIGIEEVILTVKFPAQNTNTARLRNKTAEITAALNLDCEILRFARIVIAILLIFKFFMSLLTMLIVYGFPWARRGG